MALDLLGAELPLVSNVTEPKSHDTGGTGCGNQRKPDRKCRLDYRKVSYHGKREGPVRFVSVDGQARTERKHRADNSHRSGQS
jgi:hypothetical protein